ncbi:hypothetical protein F5J12DRAFT_787640 [Pisolithus orientalis]|uniref:uncharacterized protein n=1 Tax=Pisolithus orientalis TaxID=936130 RepID=UPI0022246965|nr:uncharacterized protein F5J12DRAFT_787640 [Pisolithus orientalis]KAI5984128.1 hypothetical protein F5J12DRAFT_787640 [Pisolithus orientalis]
MWRAQVKDMDMMVAPVQNVKGLEVLSLFLSALARRKVTATLHSEGCWVVKSYLLMRTLPEGLGVHQQEYATWIKKTHKSLFSSEVQNVQLVDHDNMEVFCL